MLQRPGKALDGTCACGTCLAGVHRSCCPPGYRCVADMAAAHPAAGNRSHVIRRHYLRGADARRFRLGVLHGCSLSPAAKDAESC